MASRARVGRYALYDEIASGGMGTVRLGRLEGNAGFTRCVAVKTLHEHLAKDPEFVAMFLDEAHLAARVRHPNVVPTLDVIADGGRLMIVMEYIHGVPLSHLMQQAKAAGERLPTPITACILHNALLGLQAVHDALSQTGTPLGMVHRDVSPQNILVGADGVTRLIDFGVAKAVGQLHTSKEGTIKGKLSYMAPEQLQGGLITCQVDIYAAAVVLWEALTGEKLFSGRNEGEVLESVLLRETTRPTGVVPELPADLDEVVMRGLSRDRQKRFGSARQMATALAEASLPARADAVGEYVQSWAHHALDERSERMRAVEAEASSEVVTVASPDSGPPTRVESARSGPRVKKRWTVGGLVGVFATGALLATVGRSMSSTEHGRFAAEVPSAEPSTSIVVPGSAAAASIAAAVVSPDPSVSQAPRGPSASVALSATAPVSHVPPPRPAANKCKARSVVGADGIIRWVRDC